MTTGRDICERCRDRLTEVTQNDSLATRKSESGARVEIDNLNHVHRKCSIFLVGGPVKLPEPSRYRQCLEVPRSVQVSEGGDLYCFHRTSRLVYYAGERCILFACCGVVRGAGERGQKDRFRKLLPRSWILEISD